jgi:hypothetical protein
VGVADEKLMTLVWYSCLPWGLFETGEIDEKLQTVPISLTCAEF